MYFSASVAVDLNERVPEVLVDSLKNVPPTAVTSGALSWRLNWESVWRGERGLDGAGVFAVPD